jgi:thioredoxin-like negative regulator of GroEL
MTAPPPEPVPTGRDEAARLLRAARAEGGEAIDWAWACLPESRQTLRLRVAQLIDAGDFEAVDALIARGRLRSPDDHGLRRLAARSLLARDRADEAAAEIEPVCAAAPHHVGAARLAARIDCRRGRAREAVTRLQRAQRHRPGDERLRREFVTALLAAGDVPAAAIVFGSLGPGHDLLRARVYRARGQLREARELLERCLDDPPGVDGDDREARLVDLIDVLEAIGDAAALRHRADRIGPRLPAARQRAAAALLGLGEFERAALVAPDTLAGAAVRLAAAALGPTRDANARPSGAATLRSTMTPPPTALVADLWRRGLHGATLRGSSDARATAPAESPSILERLLADAADRFDRDLTDAGPEMSPAERQALARHRGLCLAALGRTRQAFAGLPEARPAPAAPDAPRRAA